MTLLQQVFQHEDIVVGHVKTFLRDGSSIMHTNITGTNREISIKGTPFSSSSVEFVVNIRAEALPTTLQEIMEDVICAYEEGGILFEAKTMNRFKSGQTRTHL